jgi:hypothetical protein
MRKLLSYLALCACLGIGHGATSVVHGQPRGGVVKEADSAQWARHLHWCSKRPVASEAWPDWAAADMGNTRFFATSLAKEDSVLIVETSIGMGSGGPQLLVMRLGKPNKAWAPPFASNGFIVQVVAEREQVVVTIRNRGYAWHPLQSEIVVGSKKTFERAIERGGVPIAVLQQLPNIDAACRSSNFDCAALYGTRCDTLYEQKGQYLLFVYNAEKSPWIFTTPAQQKRNMEVLGFLYIKHKTGVKQVATVRQTDTLYQTATLRNQWPVLVAKGKYGQGELFYVFNNAAYKIIGRAPPPAGSAMRRAIYHSGER